MKKLREIRISARTTEKWNRTRELFESFPEELQNQVVKADEQEFGGIPIFELNKQYGDSYDAFLDANDLLKVGVTKDSLTFVYKDYIFYIPSEKQLTVSLNFVKK